MIDNITTSNATRHDEDDKLAFRDLEVAKNEKMPAKRIEVSLQHKLKSRDESRTNYLEKLGIP